MCTLTESICIFQYFAENVFFTFVFKGVFLEPLKSTDRLIGEIWLPSCFLPPSLTFSKMVPAEILPCFASLLGCGTFSFTGISEWDDNSTIMVGDRLDVNSWFLSSSYFFLS